MRPRALPLASLALLTTACVTVALNSPGERVAVVEIPPADCEKLGWIRGEAGDSPLAAISPIEKIAESALNDARNKAAERGATHIVLEETCTPATVSAFALRCRGR
jgi:hypothetical protein